MSDIVDNRREKLVDTIDRILDSTESARFAVGYFFVSGLTAVQNKLEDVKERRTATRSSTMACTGTRCGSFSVSGA